MQTWEIETYTSLWERCSPSCKASNRSFYLSILTHDSLASERELEQVSRHPIFSYLYACPAPGLHTGMFLHASFTLGNLYYLPKFSGHFFVFASLFSLLPQVSFVDLWQNAWHRWDTLALLEVHPGTIGMEKQNSSHRGSILSHRCCWIPASCSTQLMIYHLSESMAGCPSSPPTSRMAFGKLEHDRVAVSALLTGS